MWLYFPSVSLRRRRTPTLHTLLHTHRTRLWSAAVQAAVHAAAHAVHALSLLPLSLMATATLSRPGCCPLPTAYARDLRCCSGCSGLHDELLRCLTGLGTIVWDGLPPGTRASCTCPCCPVLLPLPPSTSSACLASSSTLFRFLPVWSPSTHCPPSAVHRTPATAPAESGRRPRIRCRERLPAGRSGSGVLCHGV